MPTPSPRPFAARAALAYLAVAALWIVASDHVLVALVGAVRAAELQTWKGALFVAFTAIALYLLLRHEALRAETAQPPSPRRPVEASRTLLLTLGALAVLGTVFAFLAWHALARDLPGDHATPTLRLLALALSLTFIACTGLVLGLAVRVERAERRSLGARLDHLARYARDAVLLVGADRAVIDANERAGEIFARPLPWFAGRPLAELCELPGAGNLDACWQEASSARGVLVDAQALRGDGRRVAVEISARPVQLRGRQYVQLLVRDVSEREMARAALAESETRLRLALAATRQGLYDIDVRTGTVSVNEEYARMLGHDPIAFTESGPAWRERLHPDDRERATRALDDYLHGATTAYRAEFRLRTASGDWIWVLSTGAIVERDAGGRPLRMLGTHIDITPGKLAEQELRASEARFRELFEANPHPMWVYDLETLAFLAVNDAAIAHYGWSREEFLGMTIVEIRPPEEVERLLEYVRRPAGGYDEAGAWRHRVRGGRVIEVEISSHVINYGGRRAEVVLAHDVTARNAALRALETEERKFRTLAEQSLVGIYIVEDGRVAYANPRAAEIFGYGVQEMIGVAVESLVDPVSRPRVAAVLQARLAGDDTPVRYEFQGRRRDGGAIMVGIHGGVAVLDGRRVLIGVLQDITDRVAAEQQVRDYVQRLERAVLGTVDAISQMVELRDPYTAGHEQRVGELAAAIAAEMGLPADVQRGLRIAGGVHDVGKITIPAEILVKPTRLTPIEFELIKTHAAQGYEILKNVEFPWPVAEVARQHHERLDGSGYPRGLRGDAILLEARITAVADVVESMASHRPYRPTLGIDAALAEIQANRGRWYDPAVADACVRLFRDRGYTLGGSR